jgi:hypothetical protein
VRAGRLEFLDLESDFTCRQDPAFDQQGLQGIDHLLSEQVALAVLDHQGIVLVGVAMRPRMVVLMGVLMVVLTAVMMVVSRCG